MKDLAINLHRANNVASFWDLRLILIYSLRMLAKILYDIRKFQSLVRVFIRVRIKTRIGKKKNGQKPTKYCAFRPGISYTRSRMAYQLEHMT